MTLEGQTAPGGLYNIFLVFSCIADDPQIELHGVKSVQLDIMHFKPGFSSEAGLFWVSSSDLQGTVHVWV